jgi:hypothetical protein
MTIERPHGQYHARKITANKSPYMEAASFLDRVPSNAIGAVYHGQDAAADPAGDNVDDDWDYLAGDDDHTACHNVFGGGKSLEWNLGGRVRAQGARRRLRVRVVMQKPHRTWRRECLEGNQGGGGPAKVTIRTGRGRNIAGR